MLRVVTPFVACVFVRDKSPSPMIYCESATNELPLFAIPFLKCPSIVSSQKLDSHSCHSSSPSRHNEMSLLATNERPLSCTCLPKLLADEPSGPNGSQQSLAIDECDELVADETVLSTSCPLPRSTCLHAADTHTFSANLTERLNDYYAYRVERKKSLTPYRGAARTDGPSVDVPDFGRWPKSAARPPAKLTPHFKGLGGPHAAAPKPKHFPIAAVGHTDDTLFPMSMPPIVVTGSSSQASLVDDAHAARRASALTASTNSIASDTVNNPHMPHLNYVHTHNSDTTQATQTSTRRPRHSIAGQMGFFKIMDIAGGFSRKMATSTNSLFSTAVISGSSSAPNLHQIHTASPSGRLPRFFLFRGARVDGAHSAAGWSAREPSTRSAANVTLDGCSFRAFLPTQL